MIDATRSCRNSASIIKKTEAPPIKNIELIAIFLTRRLIARCSCQSTIIGPKIRLLSSQLCRRVDDLEKQPAASKIKGVVGKPGKTTPSNANAKKNRPKRRKHHLTSIKYTSLKYNYWYYYFSSLSLLCNQNRLIWKNGDINNILLIKMVVLKRILQVGDISDVPIFNR